MTLRQNENEVMLDFPQYMTFEIKVEDKIKKHTGTKRELEIELEWYLGADDRQTGVRLNNNNNKSIDQRYATAET
jgi:hypothetical protein